VNSAGGSCVFGPLELADDIGTIALFMDSEGNGLASINLNTCPINVLDASGAGLNHEIRKMSRRADLFQIVQILRGRLTTAGLLAERLGVSERTIYRDIRDLSLSGVPVEGRPEADIACWRATPYRL
jgi:biotin operon repressor